MRREREREKRKREWVDGRECLNCFWRRERETGNGERVRPPFYTNA
jgi:hypothetical protein